MEADRLSLFSRSSEEDIYFISHDEDDGNQREDAERDLKDKFGPAVEAAESLFQVPIEFQRSSTASLSLSTSPYTDDDDNLDEELVTLEQSEELLRQQLDFSSLPVVLSQTETAESLVTSRNENTTSSSVLLTSQNEGKSTNTMSKNEGKSTKENASGAEMVTELIPFRHLQKDQQIFRTSTRKLLLEKTGSISSMAEDDSSPGIDEFVELNLDSPISTLAGSISWDDHLTLQSEQKTPRHDEKEKSMLFGLETFFCQSSRETSSSIAQHPSPREKHVRKSKTSRNIGFGRTVSFRSEDVMEPSLEEGVNNAADLSGSRRRGSICVRAPYLLFIFTGIVLVCFFGTILFTVFSNHDFPERLFDINASNQTIESLSVVETSEPSEALTREPVSGGESLDEDFSSAPVKPGNKEPASVSSSKVDLSKDPMLQSYPPTRSTAPIPSPVQQVQPSITGTPTSAQLGVVTYPSLPLTSVPIHTIPISQPLSVTLSPTAKNNLAHKSKPPPELETVQTEPTALSAGADVFNSIKIELPKRLAPIGNFLSPSTRSPSFTPGGDGSPSPTQSPADLPMTSPTAVMETTDALKKGLPPPLASDLDVSSSPTTQPSDSSHTEVPIAPTPIAPAIPKETVRVGTITISDKTDGNGESASPTTQSQATVAIDFIDVPQKGLPQSLPPNLNDMPSPSKSPVQSPKVSSAAAIETIEAVKKGLPRPQTHDVYVLSSPTTQPSGSPQTLTPSTPTPTAPTTPNVQVHVGTTTVSDETDGYGDSPSTPTQSPVAAAMGTVDALKERLPQPLAPDGDVVHSLTTRPPDDAPAVVTSTQTTPTMPKVTVNASIGTGTVFDETDVDVTDKTGAPTASPSDSSCTDCCRGINACLGNTGTIANSSCNGNYACLRNRGDIGPDSCNDAMACNRNKGSIANGSCNGVSACTNNHATIEEGACNDSSACAANYGEIFGASCGGNNACFGNEGIVRARSCGKADTCGNNHGTVGEGSCNKSRSCLQNAGTIGSNSCNGDHACHGNWKNISDGVCNTASVC